MKKITLDLNHLAVESFETAAAAQARGTVEGHATAKGGDCGSFIDNCPSGMCATLRPEDCVSFDLSCPTDDAGCL